MFDFASFLSMSSLEDSRSTYAYEPFVLATWLCHNEEVCSKFHLLPREDAAGVARVCMVQGNEVLGVSGPLGMR